MRGPTRGRNHEQLTLLQAACESSFEACPKRDAPLQRMPNKFAAARVKGQQQL